MEGERRNLVSVKKEGEGTGTKSNFSSLIGIDLGYPIAVNNSSKRKCRDASQKAFVAVEPNSPVTTGYEYSCLGRAQRYLKGETGSHPLIWRPIFHLSMFFNVSAAGTWNFLIAQIYVPMSSKFCQQFCRPWIFKKEIVLLHDSFLSCLIIHLKTDKERE